MNYFLTLDTAGIKYNTGELAFKKKQQYKATTGVQNLSISVQKVSCLR